MYTRSSLLVHRTLGQRAIVSSLSIPPCLSIKPSSVPITTVKESSLSANVRIISVDGPIARNTLSIFVNAGTRYENHLTSGSSHFLKKLAFRGHTSTKTALRNIRDLEHFGFSFSSQANREYISYHAAGPRYSSFPSLNVVVESLRAQLSPLLFEWQVNEVTPLVKEDLSNESTLESLIQLAHFEAFKNSGLSNPVLAPAWQIENLDQRHLAHHVQTFYHDLVLVGTGVNHGELVSVAEVIFKNYSPSVPNPELLDLPCVSGLDAVLHSPQWVGGAVVRSPGPQNAAHVLVAFPGSPRNSLDLPVYSVLAEIFNLSNIYREDSGKAFHMSYDGVGFFGVYVEGPEGEAARVLSTVHDVVTKLPLVKQERLEAAKKLAALNHAVRLENPLELARELVTKRNKSHLEIENNLKQFKGVSIEDICRVATSFLSTPSVVVVSGDVRGI
eukprot:TRINITY_DN3601_c0_g1_i3.p1 TRINITY_DN3601_c0_g1~~TRINITY_DN3601_c0_g1_i3.p1  ORF type:complete len:444 (-),score=82.19 TRINITY_DN3601_c0_g1_i3:143-1474(-)